jgi:hypothetical protein
MDAIGAFGKNKSYIIKISTYNFRTIRYCWNCLALNNYRYQYYNLVVPGKMFAKAYRKGLAPREFK